ncbi:MAG TPA: signal peptide peptidase SppA [Tepidisphaeraceae bacterium]|jgi:protease-4
MTQSPGPVLPPPIPPVYFPPPAFYPPAPRGGFARAVFTALAVSILGFSLTLNVYLILASGVLSSNDVRKTNVRAGDLGATIAVLPINGVITDEKAAEFDRLLGEVEADSTVKAVVLEVNSPGGSVTASDQIYARVLRLRATRKWPVIVSMGALATSGGYYVACAADRVVAQRTTWTGNIGVLLPRYNVSKLAGQYGVEDITIKSTGSEFKDAGSPLKPDTAEQREYFQKLADDAFVVFKKVVQTGRSLDEPTVDRIANGKVYSGSDALSLKLVDAVGYLDDAIDLAVTQSGGGRPQAIRFERTVGLFEAIGGGSSKSAANVGVGAGPLNVSLDRALIDDLLTPRPMYLWRGQ